jgi:hypothetical protein
MPKVIEKVLPLPQISSEITIIYIKVGAGLPLPETKVFN